MLFTFISVLFAVTLFVHSVSNLQPNFLTNPQTCLTKSGELGLCKPFTKCVLYYTQQVPKEPEVTHCPLDNVNTGVCCPMRCQQNSNVRCVNRGQCGLITSPRHPPVFVPRICLKDLQDAAEKALFTIDKNNKFITEFCSKDVIEFGSSTSNERYQLIFQSNNETMAQGQTAWKTLEASKILAKQFCLSPDQARYVLPLFSVLNTSIGDTCEALTTGGKCVPEKYRSADGYCNNLENPKWGQTNTQLLRILQPRYDNGVDSPRCTTTQGRPLPSARVVSTSFSRDAHVPLLHVSLLVMQWGQFLDHDLTHAPITKGDCGKGIQCCKDGKAIPKKKRHPDCFPICVPENDYRFGPLGETCMNFVRSMPALRSDCNFGPREQMNQVSGIFDGSNVYGSDQQTQNDLREFKRGRLRVQCVNGLELLPPSNECSNKKGQMCFKAGDSRVNEQIQLTVMHTIWLREHNRVARTLCELNPHWNDERIFQETRSIVVAEMQHITYNEWLPMILGNDYTCSRNLVPREDGYTKLYDPNINPGITNAFAAAAFRFGHTLLNGILKDVGLLCDIRDKILLRNTFFSPFPLYEKHGIEDLLRGLAVQSSQKADRFFTKEVTDFLFQIGSSGTFDLVALNIQRGRDHGIPPYNEWRCVCNLPKIKSWSDLTSVMSEKSVQILKSLYPTVDDIELFPAGVAEYHVPGALLGPTFVCIIGDQFTRARRGDRFFYEEGGQVSSFTPAQLKEIKKSNIARVMCDNSDVGLMQQLAFFRPSDCNPRIDCRRKSILRLNLKAWEERRNCSGC